MANSRTKWTRHLALALIAACSLGLGTKLLLRADEPNKDLVIWDGDTKADGKAWTSPTSDKITLKPNTKENHGGKQSLEFHGEGKDWMGYGWNWFGWWPADAGTDLSSADRVSLWVKVTGDKKPADFNFALISSGGKDKKNTPPLAMTKYVKDAKPLTDGDWHQVIIPLKDIYADKTDFDPKLAWEFDIGEFSQDDVNFSIFVDNVQFLTPAPATASAPAATAPAK